MSLTDHVDVENLSVTAAAQFKYTVSLPTSTTKYVAKQLNIFK